MPNNLPSGTVTFLFTDIEGSTKLAHEYPGAWDALQKRHHAILDEAITSNNGFIFQIVGDAFCAAFHTVPDALNAALKAQRLIYSENWNPAAIKVRMGINTGAAEVTESGGYRGYLAMSYVQRIMSAGHGGQVLVSQTSQHLARGMLLEGVSLRDLGDHRLKDFAQPERIYQLVIPGLVNDFAPLKTSQAHPTNLPNQLSKFVGRVKEVGQIKRQLEQSRLVTLMGSGGIGKTRLSIEVASALLAEYADGVWFVELAPITDPSLMSREVCAALEVTPQGSATALSTLADYLSEKKSLLVVDNCEHLIEACAQLAEALLRACPQLRIIASSREALGIDGESAYRVPSLSLADPKEELQIIEQSEAVQLFLTRACAILPGYTLTETNAPTIAKICQRLDGIALAIELAASRVKLLKVEQIAARLDDAFRLLTGGSRTALPRQQTLRGTIDWSYNLLTDEERTMLRRLSVFTGGWTLEAAEAVCENEEMLDLLIHLVDKSLVVLAREQGSEARYSLLETIRQYAREKLAESGEGEQIRARHLDYFLKLAQKAEPELYGSGQIEWSQKLEEEHENLRAALEWSLQGNIEAGQQLTLALWWSWDYNGHLGEGHEWLQKMLEATSEDDLLIRAKLLSGAGWLAAMMGNSEQSTLFSEESVALFRQCGDMESAAFPLITLATRAYFRQEYNQANALANEGREWFRRAGNKWGVRHALGVLGYTAESQNNFDLAQKYYEESLSICNEIGDREGKGWTLYIMGWLARSQGDDARASELFEETLEILKEVKGKPVMAWALNSLGLTLLQRGDFERSLSLFEESLEINRKMGDPLGISSVLNSMGWCARLQGDYPKAQSFYREGLQLIRNLGNDITVPGYLVDIGILLGKQGHPEKFAQLLGFAQGLFPDILRTFAPSPRTETEQVIETARAALGGEAYQAAWEAGKQMGLDEAVTFALKELQQ